jgi:hypothetical protein
MILRVFISFLVFLTVCSPMVLLSVPVVAWLLCTDWDGRTTIFGNAKWGRATDHFAYPTEGKFWKEFLWLVYRNPVNNLLTKTLAYDWKVSEEVVLNGDLQIGDKVKGGFYSCFVGKFWEYYWIKPYGSRCIRARIGWKLYNSDHPAAFVFAFNPWKQYLGE